MIAASTSTGFDRFIEMAINKVTPVETLERLLAMQKDIMATQAKAAFDEAMRAFQKECPVIQKHKRVMNKDGHSVRYIYAPLDDIIEDSATGSGKKWTSRNLVG
jgi:predicted PhzF superfamily epimerase YddE/YHI9